MAGPPAWFLRSALISVTDLSRSAAFYASLMGLEELEHDGDVVVLGSEKTHTFTLFLRQAGRGATHYGPQALGVRGLSFEVPSRAELGTAEKRLRDLGALVWTRPLAGEDFVVVRGNDPDGLPLVFLTYEDGPVAERHLRNAAEMMYSFDV